jgi:hypothetical protein
MLRYGRNFEVLSAPFRKSIMRRDTVVGTRSMALGLAFVSDAEDAGVLGSTASQEWCELHMYAGAGVQE